MAGSGIGSFIAGPRSELPASGFWQAGDANTGMRLVANVQADQQGGDLFYDAGILELAAVERADAGNPGGERTRNLGGARVVTADQDVAFHGSVFVQQLGGNILKSGNHPDSVRYQFGGFLGGRSLPDAESARGASADTGGKRHGGIHDDGAGTKRRLQLLEQLGVALEGNGEDAEVGARASGGIFFAPDVGLGADLVLDFGGGLLGTLDVARSDDDGFSGARPAQGQAEAFGASTAEHRNGAAHANSGWSDCSRTSSTSGSLI